MLESISNVEAQAYPVFMQSLQDIQDVSDVLEYCESKKVTVLYSESMYVMVTKKEVVDLCCIRKLGIPELLEIKAFLKSHFGSVKFTMDAREATSYTFIRFLARRGELEILKDSPWEWGGEVFHELKVRFVK